MAKTEKNAELSTEELIAQLQAENEALKSGAAEKDRKTADAFAQLQASVKGGGPLIPVRMVEIPGTFEAKWNDPMTGEPKSKNVKFQMNQQAVRLTGGITVSSAAMMRLANGETLTADELAASPALVGWTSQRAADFLTDLVKKGYTMLVEAA